MISKHAKKFQDTPLSILDLAPINEGETPVQSFQKSVALIQHAEQWGFNRYWVAEHHNMPGIASSATAVVIGHLAAATSHIRVGAGGVMLPNHSPLIVAEQFGTLASLFPNRIDLGLGRAPGTDPATSFALRRDLKTSAEAFPMLVNELEDYFSDEPISRVRAVPGQGTHVPIWLLGSSGFSAQLAAKKGLPFSFASHFAPAYLETALELYRDGFQPSDVLVKPYVMLGVNVVVADTSDHAAWLATSQQQQFLHLRRNQPTKLQPPIDDIDTHWSPIERAAVMQTLDSNYSLVGNPAEVKQGLEQILENTNADELIIQSQIFDQQARLHSYEIIAEWLE